MEFSILFPAAAGTIWAKIALMLLWLFVRAAVVNNRGDGGKHLNSHQYLRQKAFCSAITLPVLSHPSPRPHARNLNRDQAAFKCHRLIKVEIQHCKVAAYLGL